MSPQAMAILLGNCGAGRTRFPSVAPFRSSFTRPGANPALHRARTSGQLPKLFLCRDFPTRANSLLSRHSELIIYSDEVARCLDWEEAHSYVRHHVGAGSHRRSSAMSLLR